MWVGVYINPVCAKVDTYSYLLSFVQDFSVFYRVGWRGKSSPWEIFNNYWLLSFCYVTEYHKKQFFKKNLPEKLNCHLVTFSNLDILKNDYVIFFHLNYMITYQRKFLIFVLNYSCNNSTSIFLVAL